MIVKQRPLYYKQHRRKGNAGREIKHEFAFIGRSNAGKSSLINMLTGHKALAQTSSTLPRENLADKSLPD